MESYLSPLIKKLKSFRNEKRAASSKKYLKDQYEFLGVDTKTRREVLNLFLKEYGIPSAHRMKEVSFYLWNLPERDFQHVAVDLLNKVKKKLLEEDINWLEQLIIQKSWWDTVDGLASWIAGTYFTLYPHKTSVITEMWMNSGNMWLQRAAIIFQLKYKMKTDTRLLSDYIVRLSDRKEFFIRKAIGWALREYSKTDKQWVKNFIQNHELSSLSYKEASKYV
jgi:3-methyladenine DNA glycosylase AlkD